MSFRPSTQAKSARRVRTVKTTNVVAARKNSLSLDELRAAIGSWLLDGEIRLSPKTVLNRRNLCEKLLWFCEREGFGECGKLEIQKFFHYLTFAHTLPEGRYGTPGVKNSDPRAYNEMRPRSRANYFRWLRTLFLYLVADGTLDESPMKTLRPPKHTDDQITPFTEEQIQALLRACQASRAPRRNSALIYLLFDTGARSSEICGLNYGDFSIKERSVRVLGKGNTARTLPLSPKTVRALVDYLRFEVRQEDDPLFTSVGGNTPGERINPDGLGQIIRGLGVTAGIDAVRCSPHTFRHTFAVMFLRRGGDPITLQTLYGHTDLDMTRRYVKFAGADVKRKHAMYSPVASLGR